MQSLRISNDPLWFKACCRSDLALSTWQHCKGAHAGPCMGLFVCDRISSGLSLPNRPPLWSNKPWFKSTIKKKEKKLGSYLLANLDLRPQGMMSQRLSLNWQMTMLHSPILKSITEIMVCNWVISFTFVWRYVSFFLFFFFLFLS